MAYAGYRAAMPPPSSLPIDPSGPPAGSVPPVMAARALTKDFGDGTGVVDIDLAVEPGTIFGFIGPSGSGKTTTVRLALGIHAPTSGEIRVLGEDPARFEPQTRSRIGYMPQIPALYPNLTAWENLNFIASLYGLPWRRKPALLEALELVGLEDSRSKKVSELSGGMQRRLALASTLAHDPELLFLDEPTAGIDPVLRRRIWDHLAELRDGDRTLVVTTQYVGEAAYCDMVGVLIEGRLAIVDTPDGLRRAAYGGEVVDLRGAEPLPWSVVTGLREFAVAGDRPRALDDHTVRVVVDDAGEAIPRLLAWCQEREVEVETAEEFRPPFDDVFVLLVEKNVGEVVDAAA